MLENDGATRAAERIVQCVDDACGEYEFGVLLPEIASIIREETKDKDDAPFDAARREVFDALCPACRHNRGLGKRYCEVRLPSKEGLIPPDFSTCLRLRKADEEDNKGGDRGTGK